MTDAATPLHELYVFQAVIRAGGVTRAAEQLCVTQSAVSQTVARLERQLGARLFQRSTRGLVLTPQGERLFAAVDGALGRVVEAVAEVRGEARNRGG